MYTVGSAEDAKRAAASGVDIIVAQGWEAGGHVRGDVATMALLPTVVDAVSPVPVISAGSIVDGRGLAAALMLGASGVWIGTRFLASEEATVDPSYKDRIIKASETGTILSSKVFNGGMLKAEPFATVPLSNGRHQVVPRSGTALVKARSLLWGRTVNL